MRRPSGWFLIPRVVLAALAMLAAGCGSAETLRPVYQLGGAGAGPAWAEWARTPDHAGQIDVAAATPGHVLSSFTFDPFVAEELTEGEGSTNLHYQSPLLDGGDVFMEVKGGAYRACDPPGSGKPAPCGSAAWGTETWSEARFTWEGGELVEKWRFESDWKPEPDDGALEEWEPVFHAALAGAYLVVPGAGGAVHVVARADGSLVDTVNPFDERAAPDPSTFVAGPLTVASDGSVYYDALSLDPDHPWTADVAAAWLVRIAPDGTPSKVPFSKLVPDAPTGAACSGVFTKAELPWPPSTTAKPPLVLCGSPRPGLNVAPAVAPDGTVYTVARAHFAGDQAFLVAASSDLSPVWAASLRGRLDDGCGSPLLPPDGAPGGCRAGAPMGVDPATNAPPAGTVLDLSSASPTVAPDGSVLFGTFTRYNHSRGHLMRFSAGGSFLASYDFGWDVTPGIRAHDGTFSAVIKDNHYDGGSYCDDETACPPGPGGPYDITQLDANLVPEWSFTSTNTMSCVRAGDGDVTCTSDHPSGFEWCINAPAIDRDGNVFATGEDGVLYSIAQGGSLNGSLFLRESVGAAYTPLSIDAEGRLHAENFGVLVVVGE
jgi:hypothetical protein